MSKYVCMSVGECVCVHRTLGTHALRESICADVSVHEKGEYTHVHLSSRVACGLVAAPEQLRLGFDWSKTIHSISVHPGLLQPQQLGSTWPFSLPTQLNTCKWQLNQAFALGLPSWQGAPRSFWDSSEGARCGCCLGEGTAFRGKVTLHGAAQGLLYLSSRPETCAILWVGDPEQEPSQGKATQPPRPSAISTSWGLGHTWVTPSVTRLHAAQGQASALWEPENSPLTLRAVGQALSHV